MIAISDCFLEYASEVLGDTKSGLTGPKIVQYCNRYAVLFDTEIPVFDSNFGRFGSIIPNKRTALYRNLKAFSPSQQFQIIKELCELPQFEDDERVRELKLRLFKKYGHISREKIQTIDEEEVIEMLHWLDSYKESLKQYESAIEKYQFGIFERNTLDDMRLALELLLKELLKNGKSLENQGNYICAILKEKNVSSELRNLFQFVMKYYMDYQNNHVKHNEKIKKAEIEFVFDITSVIMKFLISTIGEKNYG